MDAGDLDRSLTDFRSGLILSARYLGGARITEYAYAVSAIDYLKETHSMSASTREKDLVAAFGPWIRAGRQFYDLRDEVKAGKTCVLVTTDFTKQVSIDGAPYAIAPVALQKGAGAMQLSIQSVGARMPTAATVPAGERIAFFPNGSAPLGKSASALFASAVASAQPKGNTTATQDLLLAPVDLSLDPVGCLLFGPSAEFGVRIAPRITLGVDVWIQGLGLLFSDIVDNHQSSPFDVASAGITSRQFLPSKGHNHWYLSESAGLVSIKTNDTNNNGTSSTGHVIALMPLVGGGYEWRFPSGMFLGIGAMVGPVIPLYQSGGGGPQSVIPFGDVQFLIGWEFGRREIQALEPLIYSFIRWLDCPRMKNHYTFWLRVRLELIRK